MATVTGLSSALAVKAHHFVGREPLVAADDFADLVVGVEEPSARVHRREEPHAEAVVVVAGEHYGILAGRGLQAATPLDQRRAEVGRPQHVDGPPLDHEGLVGGGTNPIELLHQSRTVHAGKGCCRDGPNRAVLFLGGRVRHLFPEAHIVDNQGEHQAVVPRVVVRRIAEHLHPGGRKELVRTRFHRDVGVPIAEEWPVAVENRESGLILGNPQVSRAGRFAPLSRAEQFGDHQQRERRRQVSSGHIEFSLCQVSSRYGRGLVHFSANQPDSHERPLAENMDMSPSSLSVFQAAQVGLNPPVLLEEFFHR